MSTLSVNNLTTLTGSTITVASGKTLDASQGFTPPTGHVLQVVSATKTDTWTYNGYNSISSRCHRFSGCHYTYIYIK